MGRGDKEVSVPGSQGGIKPGNRVGGKEGHKERRRWENKGEGVMQLAELNVRVARMGGRPPPPAPAPLFPLTLRVVLRCWRNVTPPVWEGSGAASQTDRPAQKKGQAPFWLP